jgi:hypothetical protein
MLPWPGRRHVATGIRVACGGAGPLPEGFIRLWPKRKGDWKGNAAIGPYFVTIIRECVPALDFLK